MSISLNATVGDSTGSGRYSALLVRNGISAFAIKRTYNAIVSSVTKNTTRPLIFSDASWAGSGAYSVALVTDLYRSWDNLQNLIPQVLQLSMNGFASVMVDACGSLGPMDEDLCARWTQLSTFMPMVRNYFNATNRNPSNGQRVNTDPSEPWIAKTDSLKLAYAAMSDRLRFSRYLYTQLYLAHTVGGSLVRPLFFDFPTDESCFWDAV
jgi:alpha-glucosidase (family GH31 glycosyl hydrolase)